MGILLWYTYVSLYQTEFSTGLGNEAIPNTPHVFVPALLAHLLREAIAQDAQTRTPALRHSVGAGLLLSRQCEDAVWRTWAGRFLHCPGNAPSRD